MRGALVCCSRHVASSRPRALRTAGLLVALALVACNAPGITPLPTPSPSPTPSPTPEPADTGWMTLEEGIELRRVVVPTGDVAERIHLVRIDPAVARFRVRYTPGAARQVSAWSALAGQPAFLTVNGGYFSPENLTTALLVSDGQTYGRSYGEFAGMFAVLPDGRVEVRWLADQPYDPAEILLEAVQSFPMLVQPGGVMGFPADADDGRPARRTAVGQDRLGRILFIVAPRGYLTLHELARWLATSDLELDVALNLDGGLSTGLMLSAGDTQIQVDSLVPVPSVIVAERRG